MQTDEKRIIEITGVTFAYPGGSTVLEELDFAVRSGERIGIIGPNGSGKTTLFHIIMGLVRPQSGRMRIFGGEINTERDFFEVRRRIGYLFQSSEDQLFCPTVMEDVAFGPLNLGRSPVEAKEIALKTLKSLGIPDFANRISHKLSHGEKKLVALASVLAMDPDVLILDEPTAGLDNETKDRLMEILEEINMTLVIASHETDFLTRMAGIFYALSSGRMEEAGHIVPHIHEHVHIGGEYPHRHENEYP